MPSLKKALSLLKKNRVVELCVGREVDELKAPKMKLFRRNSRRWLDDVIESDDATLLAEALKENTSVRVLYLRGNAIGDAGACRIAEALELNSTLVSLDLSENGIGDAGAIRLAQALERNTTLRELQLSANRIATIGAIRLAEALEKNSTLRIISLLHNIQIEAAGLNRLVDALEVNNALGGVMLSTPSLESLVRVHNAATRNRISRKAADLLSLVVFTADGHLKVRDLPSSFAALLHFSRGHAAADDSIHNHSSSSSKLTEREIKTIRFLNIMKRLPFDLQMAICAGLADMKSEFITFRFLNPALQEVARFVRSVR